jgi:hypothetical protein
MSTHSPVMPSKVMLGTCGLLARIVTRSFQYKQQQQRALGVFSGCRSFANTGSMATPGSAPQEFDLVTIGAGALLSSTRLSPPPHAAPNVHVPNAHACGNQWT